MRILLAAQGFLAVSNGPSVFANRLARGLAQAGHEVLVLTPSDRGRPRHEMRDGIAIRALRSVPLARDAGVWVTPLVDPSIGRLLDAYKPDVVHLQDHYPTSRAVLHASLRRQLPRVATNHFVPENFTAGVRALALGRRLVTRLLWRGAMNVLARVDLVVAPTATAARLLVDRGLKVPVEAISCGVDLQRFSPEVAGTSREPREIGPIGRIGPIGLVGSARFLVAYVGRLDREKEVDLLFEALRRTRRDDVVLVLAGTGRDEARLRALSAPLGARVRFLGHVEQERLADLLRAMDLFAMPCRIELQSIATLEAMACGLPVLAARGGALPELVEDGVNGALFRPGDADDAARKLEALLATSTDRAALGAASIERAASHDVAQTVRRYLRVYERAIRGSRPGYKT